VAAHSNLAMDSDYEVDSLISRIYQSKVEPLEQGAGGGRVGGKPSGTCAVCCPRHSDVMPQPIGLAASR
jgi:hypothetical protein